MRKLNNVLVTGGAGFIGSNFIHYILETKDFTGRIVNFDKLTYAGNLENLKTEEEFYGGNRYFLLRVTSVTQKTLKKHLKRLILILLSILPLSPMWTDLLQDRESL